MIYMIELPWPPSVNNYKKVGRLVTTKSGKLYQQRRNTGETDKFYFDTYILVKQKNDLEWVKFAYSETITYELVLTMHPPSKIALKRWDLDNHLKVTLDALVRAKVLFDDSQIIKLLVQKEQSCENGKILVVIRAAEQILCT